MATSDWLDLRGWIEGLVGWSMDNVHDALPADDIDATVTISLPTGIWPEDIILGRVFNLLGEPVDKLPPAEVKEYRPIHTDAIAFDELQASTQDFQTGINVIDLLTP